VTHEMLELRIGGPFSDHYTVEVVWGIAEAVRVVNHAVTSTAGLTRPQTVHAAASALGLAAMRLEATCRQLAGFLTDQQKAGHIAVARPAGGAAVRTVASAVVDLGQARAAAAQLKSALQQAAAVTGDLVVAKHASTAGVRSS
jgi:hypothetical protein